MSWTQTVWLGIFEHLSVNSPDFLTFSSMSVFGVTKPLIINVEVLRTLEEQNKIERVMMDFL